MGGDPEVSIIISTRNRAPYLEACLSSLADQESGASYEVVVVDNGSTDGTAQILEAWAARDPRFRIAHEPRLGLSHGKNAGVGMAAGELLLFTDDDAIVSRRWIQSYRDFFDRSGRGLALAGGAIVPIPHDLGPWPAWLPEEALVDLALLRYDGERILHPPEYVWGGNMGIPRRVMEKMGPWDDTLGRRGDERGTFEDTEYQDRVRASGGAVWFCPEASIHHRVDRSRLVPRAVVETAFARGRNAFWAEGPRLSTDPDTYPRADLLRGIAALGVDLARWTAWSLAFRLYSTSTTFDGARRAAWSTGRSLDRLRPGRSRLYRAVARGTFRLRSPALRLTRGTP